MQVFKGHNCLGKKRKFFYLLEFSAPVLLETCYYLYSKTERLSTDVRANQRVCVWDGVSMENSRLPKLGLSSMQLDLA